MEREKPLKETVPSALWSLNLTKRKFSGVEQLVEITFIRHAFSDGLPPRETKMCVVFIVLRKEGQMNEEGYVNVADQLGLSGERGTKQYL
ncbi:hypothetical protein EYZ11_007428 [Aspergillus tanneri]|uniref:Uncharacterized protein n=1 Tax=Aspergillus tanneri TaxID=1220188 RepID=A0A4S3JD80_9EURO|nr:hypothetical protein EYZ11_007428 [Aspergillus tanneri]